MKGSLAGAKTAILGGFSSYILQRRPKYSFESTIIVLSLLLYT